MNNTTMTDPFASPNYPFFTGYLQSEMANLAYDYKFFQMKDPRDRHDYIQKIINEAKAAAIKYQISIGN